MGILITKSDFVGKYSLVKSINDKIDAFIEDNEEQILIDLLGVELFELFQSDLVNKIPVTDKYLVIYNKFNAYTDCISYQSKGMKSMLLSMIYFEIARESIQKTTQTGVVKNTSEVSETASNTVLFKMYNDGVKSYRSIQRYILENESDYLEFKGTIKQYSNPF